MLRMQLLATPLRSELSPADAPDIAALVTRSGFFSVEEIAIARELADERLAKGAASGYEFLLADGPDGLAAYTCFGRIPGTLAAWDLYWIVVDPALQGQGLGRRLCAATEAEILRLGGQAVYIETSARPQYAPTRAFYQACGYALAAEFSDFYAPGDAKQVWVRRL